jgi:hypothetical protein
LANNATLGFFSDVLPEPMRRTLRQLSLEGSAQGPRTTVRRAVGSGSRTLWTADGVPIEDADGAKEIVERHLEASERTPLRTTYAAALFDAQGRPTDTLVIPSQRFGSHLRGPTESHDASAERLDHRGHGVSQAQTQFPPGVHRALMTSQSPEMNTAVQLPWEFLVDRLKARRRIVFWEVHNEFTEPTEPGMLPRAMHQRYVIASANEDGDDVIVHVNALISQR